MGKKQGPATPEQIIKAANKEGCAHWGIDLARAVKKNIKLEAENKQLRAIISKMVYFSPEADNYYYRDTRAGVGNKLYSMLRKALKGGI